MWSGSVRRLQTAGFVVAAFAYLLPFLDYHIVFVRPVLGAEIFLSTFQAVPQAPSIPLGLYYFAVAALPPMAALAGLVFRGSTRRRTLASLIFATVGFAGLALGYLWRPNPPFAFGYYAAEFGFLVAGGGALLRFLLHDSFRPGAPRDEPSESASQWLVRRSRSGW
jgi:hypothetical protein